MSNNTLLINDLDFFDEIREIYINQYPNSEFTTTINNKIYKIEIKTFINNKTQISIFCDDEFIGGGFIKCGVNYCYLNNKEKGAFFFLQTTNLNTINFNFEDFNTNIQFFYGTFKNDIDINSQLEDYYCLLSNNEPLAEW